MLIILNHVTKFYELQLIFSCLKFKLILLTKLFHIKILNDSLFLIKLIFFNVLINFFYYNKSDFFKLYKVLIN